MNQACTLDLIDLICINGKLQHNLQEKEGENVLRHNKQRAQLK